MACHAPTFLGAHIFACVFFSRVYVSVDLFSKMFSSIRSQILVHTSTSSILITEIDRRVCGFLVQTLHCLVPFANCQIFIYARYPLSHGSVGAVPAAHNVAQRLKLHGKADYGPIAQRLPAIGNALPGANHIDALGTAQPYATRTEKK